jgi:Flavodoxin
MRAIVIYESIYGNTHAIAEAIAAGFGDGADTVVIPAVRAQPELLDVADLVVAGGPTHIHGMSSWRTRKGAVETARKPGSGLVIDADADAPGLREWLDGLAQAGGRAAAFDTRLDGPAAFTGRASKTVARHLARHGFTMVAPPESFLVSKANQLLPGEADRATEWGRQLARTLATVPA